MSINKNLFIDPRSVGNKNPNGDGLLSPNFISMCIFPASVPVVPNQCATCPLPIIFQYERISVEYTYHYPMSLK